MNNELKEIILNDHNVNNYTKMLIILYWYDKYKNNYIPNQKLINRFKISKSQEIRIINKMKKEKRLSIYYKGKKRYFKFLKKKKEEEKLDNYEWYKEE